MISIIQAGLQQLSVPSDWLRVCECTYIVYIYNTGCTPTSYIHIYVQYMHTIPIHTLLLSII